MKETITLHEDEWVSLLKMVYPEKGVNGYTFSHETRCDGKIVSIIPFKYDENGDIEWLVRHEFTPCWSTDERKYSSITGGVERNDPWSTAVHELKEEAGFTVTVEDLIFLGNSYGTKSSDTLYYYFSIDLTGFEQGEITTDGSELEKNAANYWMNTKRAVMVGSDPLLFTGLMKALVHNVDNEGE
jgi:hypothetical protein